MASRRVRIKGIANIPQRKRPLIEGKNDESAETEAKDHPQSQPDSSNVTPTEVVSPTPVVAQRNPEKLPPGPSTLVLKEPRFEKPVGSPTGNGCNEHVRNDIKIADYTKPIKHDERKDSAPKIKHNAPENNVKPSNNKPLVRRRFIKPVVSHNAINRTPQPKISAETSPVGNKNGDVNSNDILVTPKPLDLTKRADDPKRASSLAVFAVPSCNTNGWTKPVGEGATVEVQKEGGFVNLKEVALPISNGVGGEDATGRVKGIVKLPKLQYIDGTKSGSDTEYPPPPASPSKFLNRPRIKAIPKLGQRRTSFSIGSASESEDETRKTFGRIRNDSVCSVASVYNDTQPSTENPTQQKKEFSSVIQRKCRRTEQSRKLAEARRDFQLKFGNSKPDRQRLTMIDLIFYNPTTSPMSQKKKRNSDTMCSNASEVTEKSEKDIDDPDDPCKPTEETALAEQSDEENTVPAPQIIIGANGEIVIDEKSLVIENKETVKGREALKQSQVVDGDFDTNYGVYKRVKRSKDWSKLETLRFYKALNTIGTDFTLMCELFPDRNRRELKMKFKKEERMNRSLIDRAVMQPIQFDMTELQKDVAVAEIEKLEAEKRKLEKEQYKIEAASTKKYKYGRRSYSKSLDSNDEDESAPKKQRKLTSRQEFIRGGINSIIDSDSDCSVSTVQSVKTKKEESDSEDEETEERTLNKIQTTRSGRISKPRIAAPGCGNVQEKTRKKPTTPFEEHKYCAQLTESESEDNSDEEKLCPGSVMILTEVDANGRTVYKSYTIDEGGNKVPVDLTPEILKNLTENEDIMTEDEEMDNLIIDEAVDDADAQSDMDKCVDNYLEQQNGCIKMTIDGNFSLPDLSLLANLSSSDIIIGEDSMVIPFEEYDSAFLNEAEVVITSDQTVEI